MVSRWQANPAGFSTLSRTESAPPSAGVTLGQRIRAWASATGSRRGFGMRDVLASNFLGRESFPRSWRRYLGRRRCPPYHRIKHHDLLPDLLRHPRGDALDVAHRLGDDRV